MADDGEHKYLEGSLRTGDSRDWQNPLSSGVQERIQAQQDPSMRIKSALSIFFVVALVVIERENNIISK